MINRRGFISVGVAGLAGVIASNAFGEVNISLPSNGARYVKEFLLKYEQPILDRFSITINITSGAFARREEVPNITPMVVEAPILAIEMPDLYGPEALPPLIKHLNPLINERLFSVAKLRHELKAGTTNFTAADIDEKDPFKSWSHIPKYGVIENIFWSLNGIVPVQTQSGAIWNQQGLILKFQYQPAAASDRFQYIAGIPRFDKWKETRDGVTFEAHDYDSYDAVVKGYMLPKGKEVVLYDRIAEEIRYRPAEKSLAQQEHDRIVRNQQRGYSFDTPKQRQ